MPAFLRAVRLSLNYKLTLVGALVSAVFVAILWGANLGVVYPFVQVVVEGKSMRGWVDERMAERQGQIDETTARLAEIEKQTPPGEAPTQELSRQRSLAAGELSLLNKRMAFLQGVEPWVDKYTPADPFSTLCLVVVFLLVATLLKSAFMLGNLMLVDRLSQLALFDLRKEFYRRTLRLDLEDFDKSRSSDLLSRFTHDANKLVTGLARVFGRAVVEPLKMIVCLSLAVFICWRLFLFSMVLVPLAFFVVKRLTSSLKRANRRAMKEISGMFGLLSEAFGGILVVKAFGTERAERQRFHNVSKEYYKKTMRISMFEALVKPTSEILGIGVISIAILTGVYLVMNEQTHLFGIRMSSEPLTLPAMMAFFAALAGISDPARKLSEVISKLQSGAAAAERIYEMFDREPTIDDPAEPIELPAEHESIELENVCFHYLPEEPVLRGVDLKIERGETIALVGPNGCGKTTLMNLLPRFYDPVQGVVRMDGIDLRQLRLRDLRGRLGIVSQQSLLFDDTVANNIRYGSPSASHEQVVEAARKAHALEFIEDVLEEGFETMVGPRGGRLSGGQRQRVALARAILRDPQVLLLDEATSQIDLESERLIHQVLEEFVKDRTTIMITHRVSTLRLADRIILMESGRVVDSGTHAQLLARSESYQRLFSGELRKAG